MLIVTGPSAAGKSTFGRIASKAGFVVIEGTDLVKDYFDAAHKAGEDMIDFCRRRYRESGEEVFAVGNYERLCRLEADSQKIIFIGPRAPGEIMYFMERIKPSRAIAIYADLTIRFHRAKLRDRLDCPRTLSEFLQRDMREHLMGLARVLEMNLATVRFNNGTLDEFQELVLSELESMQPEI